MPFLDHELVELAMQLPPTLKIGGDGKYVLKKIARGLLPDAVIDRPKGYFPVPALKFVRGPFLDFMRDIVNSRACRERGLFQRAYLDTPVSYTHLDVYKRQGRSRSGTGAGIQWRHLQLSLSLIHI